MMFRGTKADLERWINGLDDGLGRVPHGHTMRDGNGPERPVTVREMYADILRRLGPNDVVTCDLAPVEEYWRQTILSCSPPEKRYDSNDVKRRLQDKGAYLIVLPTVGPTPVLCASGMHFSHPIAFGRSGNLRDTNSASGYSEVTVSTPPKVYQRKKVLGQRTRYREEGRPFVCYGDATSLHRFIQGQRRGEPPDARKILRQYMNDYLPQAVVEHYIAVFIYRVRARNRRVGGKGRDVRCRYKA